ncbi:ATP-binding protein [Defluviimonas salinarum]|uniref:ATP-binding protein n=1 Tax=Defluviimonas salinarum TaxID=2992147 RepID=A0ABT3JAB0_9RHOB|nr:ATP-binding protein [Defluviimonas salinarum]MCW3784390.1 ATP-binding protein [Defluviimonas salinarum]
MNSQIDQSRIPGLIRMIVVDPQILPGRIEEIPLDGHTAIIAGNGSGKTSLIQLMPLFLGEEPRRVVPSGERDGFIEFYLPRSSSYIAFEYRNRNGEIRSVVIHADPSRERIQYRFVRAPLAADMFRHENEDGDLSFIPSGSLEGHLRALGADPAPRLVTSTSAYRGIIQGRIDAMADSAERAYHRDLARDYSLAPSRAPLTGIESLLTKMLHNNVSMETMLTMIAQQATENGKDSFEILGSRRSADLEAWPKNFAAYRKIMALEPKARDLAALARAICHREGDRAARLGALAAIRADFAAEDEAVRARISAIRAEAEAFETGHAARRRGLKDTVADGTSAISRVSDRIRSIGEAAGRLRAAGAHLAAEKVAALPRLRGLLRDAEDHHEALTRGSGEVLRRFDGLRSELKDRSHMERAELREIHAGRLRDNAIGFDEVQTRIDGAIAHLRAEADEVRAALQAEIDTLAAEREALVVERAGLAPDDAIAERLSRLEAAMRERIEAQAQAARALAAARGESGEARHEYEKSEMARGAASAAMDRAAADHEAAQAEFDPKDGTLLTYLRRNVPGWGETIGRVIRPDILQKTGLSPDFDQERAATVFGLTLDLDKLPCCDAADITAIQERLERANAALEAAQATHAAAETRLQAAAARLRKAGRALSEAEVALGLEETRLEQARNALRTGESERAAHLEEKGRALAEAIAASGERLATRKNRTAELAREIARREAELRGEADVARRARDARAAGLAGELASGLAGIDAGEAAAMARLEADMGLALREGGLDAEVIAAAAAETTRIRRDLDEARAAEALAETWARHLEEAAGVPALEQDLSEARFRTAEAERALRDEEVLGEERRKGFASEKAKCEKRKEEIGDDLVLIDRILREAGGGKEIAADRNDRFDEGFEVNRTQLRELDAGILADRQQAQKSARELASAFRNCGDQTIADFLRLGSADLGDAGPEWSGVFLRWFDGEHEQHFDMLMQGILAVIQPIRKTYNDLVETDRAIRDVNRKLREALLSNADFPHVRDVDISLRSAITDQPFWKDLEALDAAHTAWNRERGGKPSEELVDGVRRLLEHWADGSEPVVHLQKMLYIEGGMTEKGNRRIFTRRTNLSDLSSNGNIIVLRLILFTALLTVMRRGQRIGLVWAVDEIGALDNENTLSLLQMLRGNDIALVTAAPHIDRRLKPSFEHHLRIHDRAIYRIGETVGTGMREWVDDRLVEAAPAAAPETEETREEEYA